jgi:hypothetical protein
MVTAFLALRNLATLKAMSGDVRVAIADLRSLIPMAQIIGRYRPLPYGEFLNALTIELIEGGAIGEARQLATELQRSTYFNAYQEWQETASDERLQLKTSNFVILNPQQKRKYPFELIKSGPSSEDLYGERLDAIREVEDLIYDRSTPVELIRAMGSLGRRWRFRKA